MSWLLMEKLLRHQQSVRSSEGCCVDRLNSPPDSVRKSRYGRAPEAEQLRIPNSTHVRFRGRFRAKATTTSSNDAFFLQYESAPDTVDRPSIVPQQLRSNTSEPALGTNRNMSIRSISPAGQV